VQLKFAAVPDVNRIVLWICPAIMHSDSMIHIVKGHLALASLRYRYAVLYGLAARAFMNETFLVDLEPVPRSAVTGSGGILLPFERMLLPTALIEVLRGTRAYQNAVTAGLVRDSCYTRKCDDWVTALSKLSEEEVINPGACQEVAQVVGSGSRH
jgi:hypothetical protein